MRRTLLVGCALLSACTTPPVPQPAASPTPAPSASVVPQAIPSTGLTPKQVAGLMGFSLAPGSSSFVTDADRRVRLVLSAATEAPGPHQVELTRGGAGAGAYRVNATAITWPYTATPRWQSATPTTTRRIAQAATREVGSEESFWVTRGDFQATSDEQRPAVLRRISRNAYFFVDRASQVSDANLEALATEFESRIYPSVTNTFGAESKPGVDGDDRLFIVITPAFNASTNSLLGYFWARDAVPAAQAEAHSNRKEVLFMSDRLLTAARVQRYGVLTHELQHLVNFSRKGARLGYTSQEATWLDEGLSMMAMDLAGYGMRDGEQLVAKAIVAFQQAPEAYSLTDWHGNPNGSSFGQSYLFMRFLVDRYGPEVLRALIDTDRVGVAAIDEVLKPQTAGFADVFRQWTVANLLQGQGPAPYRYASLDLMGTYAGQKFPGFRTRQLADGPITLRPWGSVFFDSPSGVSAFEVESLSPPILGTVTQD